MVKPHASLTSALTGDEWWASRSGGLNFWRANHRAHWTGGMLDQALVQLRCEKKSVFSGNLMLPPIQLSVHWKSMLLYSFLVYNAYSTHGQSKMVMCVTQHISYHKLLSEFWCNHNNTGSHERKSDLLTASLPGYRLPKPDSDHSHRELDLRMHGSLPPLPMRHRNITLKHKDNIAR